MQTLFPASDFDDWADSYDYDVSFEENFPFDGYTNVLKKIFSLSAPSKGESVLDLGIGTGNLSVRFAKEHCDIWGLDFSGAMLEKARMKLPDSRLGQADIAGDWPVEFRRKFNCIISAYTFHHFPLDQKVKMVSRLLEENLLPGGRLVIGDISFVNAMEEADMRRKMGQDWEQEYYWLADETVIEMHTKGISAHFLKISSCAGVFCFDGCN